MNLIDPIQKRSLKIKRKIALCFTLTGLVLGAYLDHSFAISSQFAVAIGTNTKPGFVTGLKLVSIDKNLTLLKLSWHLSPKNEKVDSYAFYMNDNLLVDQSGGTLISISNSNSATITLGYHDFYKTAYRKNHASIYLASNAKFWVIAHNANGWGKNAPFTDDPNYWLSNTEQYVHVNSGSFPFFLLVKFPCIEQAQKLGFCTA